MAPGKKKQGAKREEMGAVKQPSLTSIETASSREKREEALSLTRAAALGDPRAQRELIDRLLDQVRRTVSYVLGPIQDAEDLSQVALVEIVEASGSFRGESSLEYWASQISFRIALRHAKKYRRREELTASNWTPPREQRDVDEEVGIGRVRTRISVLMQQLSPKKRTALVLRLVEGYSQKEIAEITGVSINTVRDRLQVGRKQLRKLVLADPLLMDWAGSGAKKNV